MNERTNEQRQGEKDRSLHTRHFLGLSGLIRIRSCREGIIFCGPKGWDRTVASKALDETFNWRSDAGVQSESGLWYMTIIHRITLTCHDEHV